jgi:hypothetical protein
MSWSPGQYFWSLLVAHFLEAWRPLRCPGLG